MNVAQARFNMVEQQVRTWEVLDSRVLNLMQRAPRERFVPDAYVALAYADICVPLAHGEVMLTPRMEARTLQSLALNEHDRVLEVGTGSGFFTYLLAALSGHVYSVERHRDLADEARARLAKIGAHNTTIIHGDGANGDNDHAPYDAIVLTGSVPQLASTLRAQLKIGGRLFAVVGDEPAMEAIRLTRVAQNEWSTDSLFETVIAPLANIPVERPFVL